MSLRGLAAPSFSIITSYVKSSQSPKPFQHLPPVDPTTQLPLAPISSSATASHCFSGLAISSHDDRWPWPSGNLLHALKYPRR